MTPPSSASPLLASPLPVHLNSPVTSSAALLLVNGGLPPTGARATRPRRWREDEGGDSDVKRQGGSSLFLSQMTNTTSSSHRLPYPLPTPPLRCPALLPLLSSPPPPVLPPLLPLPPICLSCLWTPTSPTPRMRRAHAHPSSHSLPWKPLCMPSAAPRRLLLFSALQRTTVWLSQPALRPSPHWSCSWLRSVWMQSVDISLTLSHPHTPPPRCRRRLRAGRRCRRRACLRPMNAAECRVPIVCGSYMENSWRNTRHRRRRGRR